MNAGATMRLQTKQVQATWADTNIIFLAADGDNAIDFYQEDTELEIYSFGGGLSVSLFNANVGAGEVNVMAFTLVTGRVDVALNGSEPASGAPDGTDWPPGCAVALVIVAWWL